MVRRHSPILLAEDSVEDVFLVRRAVEKLGLPNELIVAHNGQEAIDFLDSAVGKRDKGSRVTQ